MKFLKNIFQAEGSREVADTVNWVSLHDMEQLNYLDDTSHHHTQVIFKHSTSCHISSMVKRSFQAESHPEEGITYYLLDLLRNRDISNAIAERYGVRHESPQVLVIRNGEVVAHGSHHEVNVMNLHEWK